MLPPTIPIFPLPNVVLFPNVFLPLHIFEPRYRAMTSHALEGDRIIGMTLLQPGFESDYHGRPPIYPVGCAGVVTHTEKLSDGRFNIVLRGIEKFRVDGEDQSQPFRLAQVTALPEPFTAEDRAPLAALRQRLEAVLGTMLERGGGEPRFPRSMPDDDLVNALSQYLDLQPIEKQALLETHGVVGRCRSLVELLEMKLLAPKDAPWGQVH